MQPVIMLSVDSFGKQNNMVFGAENQTDMLYTYYVPFPKTKLTENLVDVLDCTKANPLLRMFMMSSTSGVMKEMLGKVLSGVELSVLPWMASSLSAMNVGFFAYKPSTSTVHAGQEASDELHLLTLRTKTLLGGVAPHQHPLGPVWVETTNFIITMLQEENHELGKTMAMKKSEIAEIERQLAQGCAEASALEPSRPCAPEPMEEP